MPSQPPVDWVRKKQLLADLRRVGVPTSADQLTRWHTAGLIPHPCVCHLGRGLGTESFYPPIAQLQALVVAWTLRIRRSFEFARWVLWCYGFPGFTEKVREDLVRLLEQDKRVLTEGLNAFLEGDPQNPIEAVALAKRAPGGWGKTRRRVGRENAATVASMFYEALTGRLARTADQYDHEELVLARRAAAAHSGLKVSSDFDTETFRDALRILARELNVPRIIAAVKAAEPRVLKRVLAEARGLSRVALEGLPPDWAANPPVYFFLYWLAFRWISPSLAKEMAVRVKEPDWPKPELPPVIRIALESKFAGRSGTASPIHTQRSKPTFQTRKCR